MMPAGRQLTACSCGRRKAFIRCKSVSVIGLLFSSHYCNAMHRRLSPPARNGSLAPCHPHTTLPNQRSCLIRLTGYPQRPALCARGTASAPQPQSSTNTALHPAAEEPPAAITRIGVLHTTGRTSNPRVTECAAGVKDQDGSHYLVEPGAAAGS